MENFDDFDIEMYDENGNDDGGITAYSSSWPCVQLSAGLTFAIFSMGGNSSTSVACATMTNVSE